MGGLAYELTEGDILTIFSQFGNPVHVNLIRDKDSGKSKGFGYLRYEDQRSTILAVDNLNGAEIMGRRISVDHTRYKLKEDESELMEAMESIKPQESEDEEEKMKEDERNRSESRRHRHRERDRHSRRRDRGQDGDEDRKRRRHRQRSRDRSKSPEDPDLQDPMKDYISAKKHKRHDRDRRRHRSRS